MISGRDIKIYKVESFWRSGTADNRTAAIVPAYHDKRALVLALEATGAHANDTFEFLAARQSGKTAVSTAITATDTGAVLNGDSGVKDKLNGHTVAAGDIVMVQADTPDHDKNLRGWMLGKIETMGNDVTGKLAIDDAFDVSDATNEFNDKTNFHAAAAVGNPAYIIDASDITSITVGAATVDLDNMFVGYPGAPLVLALVSTTEPAAHRFTATIAYVD